MEYPRYYTSWQELVERFVKIAKLSPRFNALQVQTFLNNNDQHGVTQLLLGFVTDVDGYDLYIVPPYSDKNWLSIIQTELNKL